MPDPAPTAAHRGPAVRGEPMPLESTPDGLTAAATPSAAAAEPAADLTPDAGQPSPVLELDRVRVWTERGAQLIHELSWTVRAGEHWALLGPNGAGKSTLLAIAGAARHPSAGAVTVLGRRFGRTDLRDLRPLVGVVDPARRLPDWLTAGDVVLTGATGTIQPDWDRYGDADRGRAAELLDLLGCGELAGRLFRICSQGERQRIRIARALMPAPPLLLLDEPAAGLDLPAREALLGALASLAAARPELATVLVSHHLEELPRSTTHALLLRDGAAVTAGPAVPTLTSGPVSDCFGLDVQVTMADGRWAARASPGWHARNGQEDVRSRAAGGSTLGGAMSKGGAR